jgi:hypothetical protein
MMRRGILKHIAAGLITPREFSIWAVLCMAADRSTGLWHGRAAVLVEDWNGVYSIRQVRETLHSLEQKGYIKRFNKSGQQTYYYILIDKFDITFGKNRGKRTNAAASSGPDRICYVKQSEQSEEEPQLLPVEVTAEPDQLPLKVTVDVTAHEQWTNSQPPSEQQDIDARSPESFESLESNKRDISKSIRSSKREKIDTYFLSDDEGEPMPDKKELVTTPYLKYPKNSRISLAYMLVEKIMKLDEKDPSSEKKERVKSCVKAWADAFKSMGKSYEELKPVIEGMMGCPTDTEDSYWIRTFRKAKNPIAVFIKWWPRIKEEAGLDSLMADIQREIPPDPEPKKLVTDDRIKALFAPHSFGVPILEEKQQ